MLLSERLGFPDDMKPVRESGLVVAVVAPIVVVVYKLWDAHFRVPFGYSYDALSTDAYTKSIIDNGWYFHTPRLAAPFTADWRDFPVGGENLHWFALKIIGLVTGDYALTVNIYFLLGFFLVALSAYFVVRYLKFSIPTALVVSVVFAFLPYHAFRGTNQVIRGVYYGVPLAILVLLWVANYRREFFSERAWRRGRLVAALVIAVVLGSSDTQYAAFFAALMAVLALVLALRDRDWRPVALFGILVGATFGMLLVNNIPYVAARIERGPNDAAASRDLSDQDQYALRPVDLVLPVRFHRVGVLADLAEKAVPGRLTNGEVSGTPLGTIGTVGFVASLGALVVAGLGTRRDSERMRFVAQLGTLNVVAILIGVVSGFAFLLALTGFRMYRTWNRISVFIAFFSLLVVAVLLDMLFSWLRTRFATRRTLLWVAIVAVVAVLTVGAAYDQTSPFFVPSYDATAARFDRDATFYHDLENKLPKGAMVFQLPVQPFPEAGQIVNMTDYQHFTGYLHTDHLQWSYGGIKGRNEGDWQQVIDPTFPASALAQIAAAGFQGVVLDASGFPDSGQAFGTAAAQFAGAPALGAIGDQYVYYDLTGLRAQLERDLGADAVAHDRSIVLGDTVRWRGFTSADGGCSAPRRRAVDRDAIVELNNTTGAPLTTTIATEFDANPSATRVDVRGPNLDDSVTLTGGKGLFSRQVTLPPGRSQVHFTLNGPAASRSYQFALVRPSFGPQFDARVVEWARDHTPGCTAA
jgi:phosphoglycerol transferase